MSMGDEKHREGEDSKPPTPSKKAQPRSSSPTRRRISTTSPGDTVESSILTSPTRDPGKISSVSPVSNLEETISSDPKTLNKFSNDGSFLSMILAQAQQETAKKTTCELTSPAASCQMSMSHPKRPAGAGPLSSRQQSGAEKKRKQTNTERRTQSSEPHSSDSTVYEDETDVRAREEFLRTMKIMEEAGLVTEKGIGAGMVK